MVKQIVIGFEGKEYTLEFTRKTVEIMERQGFILEEIHTKPMTTLPKLFSGAFLANHKFIKQEVVDAIFSQIKDKDAFVLKLAELYNEPIVTLIEEPDEGNAQWEASW